MINDVKKNAVLQEYFTACKMIFRIKATINYTWCTSFEIEKILNLFLEDDTFRKMEKIVI